LATKAIPLSGSVSDLDRFVAMEEIWGFESDLVAVMGNKSNYSIVIRQDWIFGNAASPEEIRQYMSEQGFRELAVSAGYKGSLSFFNESFAVFDLRPANVVRTNEGFMIPIDCFINRLDPEQFRFLEDHS